MDPFKPAKLFDAGGDLSERWSVCYYYLNPDTGKYQRFRDWVPASIHTAVGRRDKAHEMIRDINTKLRQGYNPFSHKEKRLTIITKALEYALEVKQKVTRKRTHYTYRYTVNSLLKWLKLQNLERLSIEQFNYHHAQAFTDYSLSELHLYNSTVNYRTMHLKTIFKLLIKREWIRDNPFEKIEKLPVEEPEIVRFTIPELQKMEQFLPVWNYDLYTIACLVFYCFLRPQEIVRLRVENINLADRSIMVPGRVSKNKKTEMVQIPDALFPVLAKLDLSFPPDWYVFSTNFRRGEKEIAPTRIAGAWREFGNKYEISKTIYALKHTGVGMAIEAGINLRDLQLQLRHYSLEMTQIYLDKFKRRPSEKLATNFPDLSRLTKNISSRHPFPPDFYQPGLS